MIYSDDKVIDLLWDRADSSIVDATFTAIPLNYVFEDGSSLLFKCCALGMNKFSEWLIDNGANLNFTDKDLNTVLHISSYSSSAVVVKKIIERNVIYIDTQNIIGQTPLMIAAKGSRIDNTIALLKENPAVNMRDATGNTPMHWALTEKNPPEIMLDVLVALKNNGADLKNKNYIGLTPLDYLNICQTWGDEYSILLKIITR